ncbi:MAG: DUF1353 domain-containing protein [Acidimicrobiales bacterium]
MRQLDRRNFALESTITYLGETGLDGDVENLELLRSVGPDDLEETDLASVPAPFRWWVNTYGVHTPAALIHDRFIPSPLDGVTDAQVDRYFRFMLQDLGVRWAKRWLIWAAVAFRTRWEARGPKRWSLIAWSVLALLGSVVLVGALIDGNEVLATVAFVAPLLASALWGRQAGAGLIAAYFGFPLLLFPGVVAGVFLVLYLAVEGIFGLFARDDRAGTESFLGSGD